MPDLHRFRRLSAEVYRLGLEHEHISTAVEHVCGIHGIPFLHSEDVREGAARIEAELARLGVEATKTPMLVCR